LSKPHITIELALKITKSRRKDKKDVLACTGRYEETSHQQLVRRGPCTKLLGPQVFVVNLANGKPLVSKHGVVIRSFVTNH
jgi:hypothetical protein